MIARLPFRHRPHEKLLLMASALALAACQPSTEAAIAPSPPQVVSRIAAEGDMTGSWRLVSFEGGPADPVHDHEILMLATSRSLRASSQCVQFWHRYDLTGQTLSVGPFGPVVSCQRGLTRTEQAFSDVLSSASEVQRVGDRLMLSSGDRRLVFEPGPPPAVVDVTGRWSVRRLDGQMRGDAEPIVVTFDDTTMAASSGCIRGAWAYEKIGSAVELRRSDVASCERMMAPWETEAFNILDAVRTAHPTPSGQLLLDAGIGQMELDRLS